MVVIALILYILLGLVLLAVLIYLLFEIHYFLRVLLSVVCARIVKKKISILDETSVWGVCLTTDIDTLVTHMNNARFLRELDFAKIDFYERTGLYRNIRGRGGRLVIGATTIRYRKFIKLFTRFTIKTKIIYWDEQSIYMEHRFEDPSGFIKAIAMCKTRITNCNVEDVISELLMSSKTDITMEDGKPVSKPPIPPELEKWIESNEISSKRLRNASTVQQA